jgi:hypothetical protein
VASPGQHYENDCINKAVNDLSKVPPITLSVVDWVTEVRKILSELFEQGRMADH